MTRQERIYQNKVNHKWNVTDLSVELSLLKGEVQELEDKLNANLSDEALEELADVAIYCYGMAAIMNKDLDAAIDAKMAKNEKRVYTETAPGIWEKKEADGTVSPVHHVSPEGAGGVITRDTN